MRSDLSIGREKTVPFNQQEQKQLVKRPTAIEVAALLACWWTLPFVLNFLKQDV